MSMIDTYRNNIVRKREALAKLSSDKAKESTKIANLRKRIDSAKNSVSRTKSEATIKSKQKEISKAEADITASNQKIAAIEGKMSKLEKEISDEQKRLDREEEKTHILRLKKESDMQKKTQQQIDSLNKTMKKHELQQLNLQGQIDELKVIPEKIKVLFLAANPSDTSPLRLSEEAREIQEMIRKSEYRDTISFETRWAVRIMDVFQAINEVKPDVIHFSGHGDINGDLVFEDLDGRVKTVAKEAMTQTVSSLTERIRFIFFNACFSAQQAESVVTHVDAAIGMTDSIGDRTAIIFAAQFYSAIGFGLSIDSAYKQARARLIMENIHQEDIPKLFIKHELSAEDIYLVRPEQQS